MSNYILDYWIKWTKIMDEMSCLDVFRVVLDYFMYYYWIIRFCNIVLTASELQVPAIK